MAFNDPAEFPEGELSEFNPGTGRGSGRPGHGGGVGGPAELPPFTSYSVAQLVSEVLNLNVRVQGVETELLSLRLSSGRKLPVLRPGGGGIAEYPRVTELQRGRFGGPQELEMEGGEGTGTGAGTQFHPRFEINEFPLTDVAKLLQAVAQVNERLSALEGRVSEVLQKISEQ